MIQQVKIDVFGLGQCSLDYIGVIDRYPPPDAKCEFTGLTIESGGPAATALAALGRWGLVCAYAGVVGDDAAGSVIASSLREEGIDTAGLRVRPGHLSQFAFIVAEPSAGRRTIFWQRPTGSELRPEEVDLSLLRRSRIFHTDGLALDAALFAAREARSMGLLVSVDAGTLREGMLELARLAHVFVVSEGFARQLVGGDDPPEACRYLASLGPALTGVTLGGKGYCALADGRPIRKPAYPAAALDTTGCGDVFHAGLCFGFHAGWNAEKSLDFAAWAAAAVCGRLGGRRGIPAWTDYPAGGLGR